MSEPTGTTRVQRLLRAATCSAAGLAAAFRQERAFQEEVAVLVLVVLPGAFLWGQTGVERALLVGSWLLVLVVELLNTAVETVVDRIGTDVHVLSGRAKDLGSAAVGVALLQALVVWVLVLGRG